MEPPAAAAGRADKSARAHRPENADLRLFFTRARVIFALVSDVAESSPEGALEGLRSSISGCELLLLADISTRTVLTWAGALKYPQEYLDKLCVQAAELFQTGQIGGSGSAVLARLTGFSLFVCAPNDPAEVLCAVLAPSGDIHLADATCRAYLEASSDMARVT